MTINLPQGRVNASHGRFQIPSKRVAPSDKILIVGGLFGWAFLAESAFSNPNSIDSIVLLVLVHIPVSRLRSYFVNPYFIADFKWRGMVMPANWPNKYDYLSN